MENTNKKTKAMYYAELRAMILETVTDEEKQNDLLGFIDARVAELDKRKEAAAKRAEKKRTESDELTEAIYAQIGDEPKTVDELVVAFDDPEITRNKITARLGKLVKEGRVAKDTVKVEGKKRVAYFLPTEGAEE